LLTAGHSSASAELDVGMTHTKLLQLLNRCSMVDGMNYLHGLGHNNPVVGVTMALARQVRDRSLLSTKTAAGVTERIFAVDHAIQALIPPSFLK